MTFPPNAIEARLFWQLLGFLFVYGACLGSFLNVVVYRVPLHMSIVRPRSACPHCHTAIPWYGLIPILGYFILNGRCRHCHSKISSSYPFFEFVVAVGTSALFVFHSSLAIKSIHQLFIQYGLTLVIFYAALVIARIDFAHQRIPNYLLLSFAVMGGGLIYFSEGLNPRDNILGFSLALMIMAITKIIFSAAGKPQSIGYGDVKYVLILGLVLGAKGFVIGLGIASSLSVLFALILRIPHQKSLPFGVFLGIGALVGRLVSIMLGQ